MVDPSLTEAMAVLDPYLEDIDSCLREGFGTYRGYPDDVIAEHDSRAATSNIYSHQLMRARMLLAPRSGVTILPLRGLWVVDFHGKVNLRFKKVNGAGRGRNAGTKQQEMFDGQMDLPGLPSEAIRVVAGYKTDAALTSIQKVLISRPYGKQIDWCVQVILDAKSRWVDITPQSLPGTEPYMTRKKKSRSG